MNTIIRHVLNGRLGAKLRSNILNPIPGLLLSVMVMLAAIPLSDVVGQALLRLEGIDPTGKSSPISAVGMAILIGLLVRNVVHPSDRFKLGIGFSVSKILRLGIICVGIKLSVFDILKLGAWGIPVVATAIVSGLVFVSWFNRRLSLPERLGTLIAAGTSICGVTAIVSVAPVIKAEDREVAYAVANITLFGLIGMLLYPYLAPHLFQTSEQIGLFFGTAIHDTSQVVGAALTYKEVFHDEVAFKTATVTKLTRNLFLAAVVPLLSLYHLRRQNQAAGVAEADVKISKLFPVFVLGFVGMALLRSIGDATLQNGLALGWFDAAAWKALTTQIGEVWGSKYLLGTAMAGVGLGTSLSVFKGVGLKPFAVGFAGALLVGFVGFVLAQLLGPFIRL